MDEPFRVHGTRKLHPTKDHMAICKFCHGQFDWGHDASLDKPWVKLVPIGEDVGMDRTHSDENGVLRAQHKCAGWTAAVEVTKLAAPIPSDHIIGQAAVELSKTATDTDLADEGYYNGPGAPDYPPPTKPRRERRKSRLGEMSPLRVLGRNR